MGASIMDYFNQESERLIFRKVTSDDIPAWLTFFPNNDRLSFLGIDVTKPHEIIATEWIHMQMHRYATQGFGSLAVIEKSTGDFIGLVGIVPREIDDLIEYEIAYSLIPTYWGKGYATEAARQMKQFGYKAGIAPYFISIIHKSNNDSIHVAKKNGMHILRETYYLGMDVYVYGTKEIDN